MALFSSNMNKADLLALLKELKISLKPCEGYKAKYLSFDADVSGKHVAVLNSPQFSAFILSRIHTFIPTQFKYSEVLPVLPLIFEKMEPSDFKVRVFGNICEDSDTCIVSIQLNELAENLQKIWTKKCITDITSVTAFSTFSADVQKFFKSFTFEKSTKVCYSVLVNGAVPLQMDNVVSSCLVAPNKYLLSFSGFCTLRFANNTCISFRFIEKERGAAPVLFVGFFAENKYYQKELAL